MKELDKLEELQVLLNSAAWASDSMGMLAQKAIRLIIDAGYTEAEAYDYIELI